MHIFKRTRSMLCAIVMVGCGGTTGLNDDSARRPSKDAGAEYSEDSGVHPDDSGDEHREEASADAGTDASSPGDGGPGDGAAPNGYLPNGFARCGPLEPERADECEGIDKIELVGPRVSAMTDGSIATGELSSVSVWAKNNDLVLHTDVCVGVTVNTPGILLFTDDNETNPTVVSQISAQGTVTVSPAYKSVRSATPGTVARFTFWSTFRGTNCVGGTVSVDALVTRYPL